MLGSLYGSGKKWDMETAGIQREELKKSAFTGIQVNLWKEKASMKRYQRQGFLLGPVCASTGSICSHRSGCPGRSGFIQAGKLETSGPDQCRPAG